MQNGFLKNKTSSMKATQKNIVSIVIPNKNRSADLIRCLESIKKQRCRDYEIIIVDDFSETKEIYGHPLLRELSARVIANPGSRGAAAAKNIGAKESRGNLIMFLDSDAELFDENVIDNVIEIMGQDSQVGAVGGDVESRNGGVYNLPLRTISLQTGEIKSVFGDWRNIRLEIDLLPTCNMTTRKDIFDRIGGFEEIFQTYYEDTDFCLRLRKLGYRIVMDSKTLAIHHRSRVGRHSSKTNFLIARNRMLFIILHG
jgi:GT2 family glycosyltransferase